MGAGGGRLIKRICLGRADGGRGGGAEAFAAASVREEGTSSSGCIESLSLCTALCVLPPSPRLSSRIPW